MREQTFGESFGCEAAAMENDDVFLWAVLGRLMRRGGYFGAFGFDINGVFDMTASMRL